MTAVQVKASPDGVPGAVTDPGRIHAEELTYAGEREMVTRALSRIAQDR